MKYMRLNCKVVSARWDEGEQQWHLQIQKMEGPNDVFEDKAHVLVNGSGVLK